MTYLVANDFRAASFDPACNGLLLSDDEANDPRLVEVIASVTQRINAITSDQFETSGSIALEVDVQWNSPRLYLPRRTTGVTQVATRDYAGTLTVQAATVYRVHSSLDTAGAVKVGELDYIDIVLDGAGLAGVSWPFMWPFGTQTVQVTGTFGWTVTPGDIKRACALMVWDVFKREAGDVRRASRWARGDLTVERATDTATGLPEADEILASYTRETRVGVG